jgi:hypothetical protein
MVSLHQLLHLYKAKLLKKSGIIASGITLLLIIIGFTKDNGKPMTDEIIHQKTDSLIQFAIHHQGIPYRRGGTSIRGFDCSGFTQHVFEEVGIQLHRSAARQFKQGIKVTPAQFREGDLVFFHNGSRINHVGVLINVTSEENTFIHVSLSEGIRLDNLQNTYYKKRFAGAKRVMLPELFATEDKPS